VKAFSFQSHLNAASPASAASPVAATPAGTMAVTQPGHMQAPGASHAGAKAVKAPDTEVTLDGNGVVLEDEMVKLTNARMDYDAAVGFYQSSLSMLKTAIRRPGTGA
jgi:flagellar basal-body rod protein FlgB